MSDQKKNKKKVNWTKAQLYGFYGLIVLGATFWSGVYLGQMAMTNALEQESTIKNQAVQEYKDELSKENL